MADSDGTSSNTSNGTTSDGPTPPQGGGGMNRVMAKMAENKVDAGLWLTRCFTVISSFAFILPIFGFNPYSCYQRALLSNAATSALRLHQRLPNFQFSREFFGLLFLEDSAHYLFYSLIFLSGHPNTMALVPVFLFALMHATSYTKTLLNLLGPNSLMLVRNLISKIETQQRNILRFIACTEIFLMVGIVLMIFTGHSSLLLPFVYYRFLTLRYSSRRNPYCRQLFYELRVTAEHLSAHASCPGMVRNATFKAISFINRLAPQVPT